MPQLTTKANELELAQDKALACLELISADICWNEWYQVLCALKSLEIDESVARQWSQQSEKFKESSFRNNWKSAKANDPLDRAIGYLVNLSGLDASQWTKNYLKQQGINGSYRPSQPSNTPKTQNKPKPRLKKPINVSEPSIEVIPCTPAAQPKKIDKPYGYDLEYIYYYSDGQWVKRVEFYNFQGQRFTPPGFDKDKTIFPYVNGEVGKKSQTWPAYRIWKALASSSKYILIVEGEQCVDHCWEIGIPAITFQGGWNQKEIKQALKLLKEAGKIPIFIPDHDQPGINKVKHSLKSSSELELDYAIFELKTIWPKIRENEDISNWISMMQNQGLTPDKVGQELAEFLATSLICGYVPDWLEDVWEFDDISSDAQEPELKAEPQSKQQPQKGKPQKSQDYSDLPPHERLKIDLQAYLASPDIFDKTIMRGNICAKYRINLKNFQLLCDTIEKQTGIPKKIHHTFDEYMELGTEGLNWLIPGLLPVGETILLAAQAKTGKTLLATDIAYSVLTGESCLGEFPGMTGKVLFVSSDESINSNQRRLKWRGFDLLPDRNEKIHIMSHLDLNNLGELEEILEDFQPQLVIIDSLTSISLDVGISENDAEYAKGIYRLKEVIGRYGASGILIHHENKDKEAKGLNKVSGSGRIVAAVWGIAQLAAAKPNDDNCISRWLKIKPREGEPTTVCLEINPKDLWSSQGIFEFKGEFGDENGEKRTHGERVLELLTKFSPKGLEYQEIDQYLNIGRSLYTVLDRLEDRQLITKRRSQTNKRRWVYFLPSQSTDEGDPTNQGDNETGNTPPSNFSSIAKVESVKTVEPKGFKVSQQLVNIELTVSQHQENEHKLLNGKTPDEIKVSEELEVHQHPPATIGGQVSSETVDQDQVGPQTLSWNNLIKAIEVELQRLQWTQEQIVKCLQQNYGKRSKQLLSDSEAQEFYLALKTIESPYESEYSVGDCIGGVVETWNGTSLEIKGRVIKEGKEKTIFFVKTVCDSIYPLNMVQQIHPLSWVETQAVKAKIQV